MVDYTKIDLTLAIRDNNITMHLINYLQNQPKDCVSSIDVKIDLKCLINCQLDSGSSRFVYNLPNE